MATTSDIFAPRNPEARVIYDALQAEAQLRKGRAFEVWQKAELEAVHQAAESVAKVRGWRVLSLEEVQRVETSALGHIDYASKWAYGLCERMARPATATATR